MDALAGLIPLVIMVVMLMGFGVISPCSLVGHKYQRADDAIFCTRCGKHRSL